MFSYKPKSRSMCDVCLIWIGGLLLVCISNISNANTACKNHPKMSKDRSQMILECEQRIKSMSETDAEYAASLLYLARLYEGGGDLRSAEEILEKINSSTKINISTYNRIRSIRQLGIVYFYKRMYEKALDQFEQSLSMATEHGVMEMVALGYNDVAKMYHIFGDYNYAAKLYLESHKKHTEVGNPHGRGSTLHNLGTLYQEQGTLEEAIVAFRQSFNILSTAGNNHFAAIALASLGKTFYLSGDTEKAIELINESIQSLRKSNAYQSLADTHIILAEVLVLSGNTEEAQEQLNKAKLASTLMQSYTTSPQYWYSQGLIWEAQEKFAKAYEAHNKALEQIQEDSEHKYQEKLYTALARLSEHRGDFKAANKFWKRYAETLKKQLSLKKTIHPNFVNESLSLEATKPEEKKPKRVTIIWLFSVAALGLACIPIVIVLNRKKVSSHTEEKTQQEKNNGKVYTSEEKPKEILQEITENHKSEAKQKTLGVLSESHNSYEEGMLPEREKDKIDYAEKTNREDDSLSPTTVAQKKAKDSDTENKDRQHLVELMHLSLQLWEEQTQLSKLELAEKSKIWSVGVDDGRLRARAMERYFSVKTLPQKPRWRSVVRTCNYVLRHCEEKSLYRGELEEKLKSFQTKIKRNATMVSSSAPQK